MKPLAFHAQFVCILAKWKIITLRLRQLVGIWRGGARRVHQEECCCLFLVAVQAAWMARGHSFFFAKRQVVRLRAIMPWLR